MSKELKELMNMLEARRMHPAMRTEEDLASAKEEGRDLHPLVLSPTRNNPSLVYIHPERLLQELEKRGEKLNLLTLEFEKKAAPAPPAPAPAPPEEKKPEEKPEEKPDPIVEDKPEEKPEEKIVEVYTKADLEKMDWETIRKAAKADPKVPGNKSKDWLTENLVGRPKFPLEK